MSFYSNGNIDLKTNWLQVNSRMENKYRDYDVKQIRSLYNFRYQRKIRGKYASQKNFMIKKLLMLDRRDVVQTNVNAIQNTPLSMLKTEYKTLYNRTRAPRNVGRGAEAKQWFIERIIKQKYKNITQKTLRKQSTFNMMSRLMDAQNNVKGVRIQLNYTRINDDPGVLYQRIEARAKLNEKTYPPMDIKRNRFNETVLKIIQDERKTRPGEYGPIEYKAFFIKTDYSKMNQNIEILLERFYQSMNKYYFLYNIKIQLSTSSNIRHSAMTIPLRFNNAPTYHLYDEQGSCQLKQNFSSTNTCFIDMFFNEYIKKYAHPYNRNGYIPNMSKDAIVHKINALYDTFMNGIRNKEDEELHRMLKSKTNTDTIIEDVVEYDCETDGVNIIQATLFMRYMRINMKVIDENKKLFYEYICPNRRKSIPSLFFLMCDAHCYPVVNKKLRKMMQNTRLKSIPIRIEHIIKEKESKKKTTEIKQTDILEIPYEYTFQTEQEIDYLFNNSTHKNKSFFIVNDNVHLKDVFLNVFKYKNERLYYKQTTGGEMTQIQLPNGNTLYKNADYKRIIPICKQLKLTFNNHRYTSILTHLNNKHKFINLASLSSNFNNHTLDILQKYLVRKNWTETYNHSIKNKTNIYKYDINKCYSHILQNSNDIEWLQFDVSSEMQPFYHQRDSIQDNGLYYVQTNQNVLLSKTGLYIPQLVRMALQNNLIQRSNIKYKLIGKSTQTNEFSTFIKYIYETFDSKDAKQMVNHFIGMLGRTKKKIGSIHYVSNIEHAYAQFCKTQSRKTTIDTVLYQENNNTMWCVDNTKEVDMKYSNHIIQTQIVQLGRCALYKHILKSKGTLIKTSTDSFIVYNPTYKPNTSNTIGHLKKQSITDKEYEKIMQYTNQTHRHSTQFKTNHLNHPLLYKKSIRTIKIDDEYDMHEIMEKIYNRNVFINGSAGSGKSTIIKRLKKEYTKENKVVKICSFTNVASEMLDGNTLHNTFGVDASGRSNVLNTTSDIDVIIVDEVSMMPLPFYNEILHLKNNNPKLRIILVGDMCQLEPVNDVMITERHVIFKELLQYKLELHIDKRQTNTNTTYTRMKQCIRNHIALENDPYTEPDEINQLDIQNLMQVFTKRQGDEKMHIVYTNEKRKEINQYMMEKESMNIPNDEKIILTKRRTDKAPPQENTDTKCIEDDYFLHCKIEGYKKQDKENKNIVMHQPCNITPNDIQRMLRNNNKKCHYCDTHLYASNFTLDRINSLLCHTLKNTVPCCLRCNKRKQNISYDEYMKRIKKEQLSQSMILYKGLPLRCRITSKTKETLNGERFIVDHINTEEKTVSIYNDKKQLTIPYNNNEFMNNFNPGYAMTIHSLQGQTINKPHVLHEIEKYDTRLLYVAITRAREFEQIRI